MNLIDKLTRYFHQGQAAHYSRLADKEEADLLAYTLAHNGRILGLRSLAEHHRQKADATRPAGRGIAALTGTPRLIPGIAINSTHNLLRK